MAGPSRDTLTEQGIYYRDNSDTWNETMMLANRLEIISAALLQEAWDLEIAKGIIGHVHCGFIESEAYAYCKNRHDDHQKIFEYTIKLYNILKPQIGTLKEQEIRSANLIKIIGEETGNNEIKKIGIEVAKKINL